MKLLDNLLYLYTKPFDIVVDPFAGGGSTIDIGCQIVSRLSNVLMIYAYMISLPACHLSPVVYLDPPYWKQAEGKYSHDPSDLANMPLEQFNQILSGLILDFAKRLKSDGPKYIALIIQPTGDMLRMVKLPVDMRFSVPYESQQYNAQTVEWAKTNKKCLVLTREIIVWRVN